MIDKTYEIKVKCENCGKDSKLNLPIGETVSDNTSIFDGRLLGFICINCGCETLYPQEEKEIYY